MDYAFRTTCNPFICHPYTRHSHKFVPSVICHSRPCIFESYFTTRVFYFHFSARTYLKHDRQKLQAPCRMARCRISKYGVDMLCYHTSRHPFLRLSLGCWPWLVTAERYQPAFHWPMRSRLALEHGPAPSSQHTCDCHPRLVQLFHAGFGSAHPARSGQGACAWPLARGWSAVTAQRALLTGPEFRAVAAAGTVNRTSPPDFQQCGPRDDPRTIPLP